MGISAKVGWSMLTIAMIVLTELLVYFFWPAIISMMNSSIASISPGGYHNMIIAFMKWITLPLFLVIPAIGIAVIVGIWREAEV